MSTVDVTVTPHSGGSVSASSSNAKIADVSVISGPKVRISGGTTAGNATITVTAGATTNYTAKSGTISVTASSGNCQCYDCDCWSSSCSCSCSCSCGG